MERMGRFSTSLLSILCILLFSGLGAFHIGCDAQIYTRAIQQVILRTWLSKTHSLVPASHNSIEKIGRWTFDTESPGVYASFPGSRLRFTITNSTSMLIVIGENGKSGSLAAGVNNIHVVPGAKPARSQSAKYKASLSIKVGSQTRFYHGIRDSVLRIAQDLDPHNSHIVVVTLKNPPLPADEAIVFESIWLSKGSQLAPIRLPSRQNVEIISQMMPALENVSHLSSAGQYATYDAFTEQSDLFNVTVTTVPVANQIGLLSNSEPVTGRTTHHPPTIHTLYFRSGQYGTPLFHKTWSWASQPNPPTVLIFDIGLTDHQTFFNKHNQQPSPHNLEIFQTAFITAYINLILTIRRTTWHQHHPSQDPVFAYTSAPSTLPILIMVPVTPPSHNPILSLTLHNTLQQMVTQLRTIEGDTRTILIDTSGWIDDNDFLPSQPSDPLPIPNAKGHRKLAHFLALHLCPYVAGDPEHCPFDRHDHYTGNTYIPEEAAVQRILEDKKVQKIKALV